MPPTILGEVAQKANEMVSEHPGKQPVVLVVDDELQDRELVNLFDGA